MLLKKLLFTLILSFSIPVVSVAQDDNTTYVSEDASVGGEDPETHPWGVDYGKLTPLLIKSIQELKAEIDTLKAELQTLKQAQ